MSDVRNLIDNIISDTRDGTEPEYVNKFGNNPVKFDKGEFREKLSMFVLKDVISAMMADQTQNLDEVIDKAVIRHLSRDFNKSTCYDYLVGAMKSCNSPVIGSVIQEIDDTVEETAKKVEETGDTTIDTGIDKKELLKDVDDYETLREKLKKKVSEQVVNDVAGVITKGNDAPKFDNIDEKITNNESVDDGNIATESVILQMCSNVILEHATEYDERLSVEDGINRAIVEYCIAEMDELFKMRPTVNNRLRYL